MSGSIGWTLGQNDAPFRRAQIITDLHHSPVVSPAFLNTGWIWNFIRGGREGCGIRYMAGARTEVGLQYQVFSESRKKNVTVNENCQLMIADRCIM